MATLLKFVGAFIVMGDCKMGTIIYCAWQALISEGETDKKSHTWNVVLPAFIG